MQQNSPIINSLVSQEFSQQTKKFLFQNSFFLSSFVFCKSKHGLITLRTRGKVQEASSKKQVFWYDGRWSVELHVCRHILVLRAGEIVKLGVDHNFSFLITFA